MNVIPTGGALTLSIAQPPAVPAISSITLPCDGLLLTVIAHGYSNIRAVDHVLFHFIAPPGGNLSTTDLTIDGAALFAPYYSSLVSQNYGSTFTYTQAFNIDGSASDVQQVQVTLVNAIGSSPAVTTQ